jgi:hypothetical protein
VIEMAYKTWDDFNQVYFYCRCCCCYNHTKTVCVCVCVILSYMSQIICKLFSSG